MHTSRSTFKRVNFNMKNSDIAFYSLKQYLSLDIYMDIYRCDGGNGDSVEVFRLSSMLLSDKT